MRDCDIGKAMGVSLRSVRSKQSSSSISVRVLLCFKNKIVVEIYINVFLKRAFNYSKDEYV